MDTFLPFVFIAVFNYFITHYLEIQSISLSLSIVSVGLIFYKILNKN